MVKDWFHILIYAKNSKQQLILSNIQRDGLQFIIIIYTNSNKNKKILYESICMNNYPGWGGSSGQPIIQGVDAQLPISPKLHSTLA